MEPIWDRLSSKALVRFVYLSEEEPPEYYWKKRFLQDISPWNRLSSEYPVDFRRMYIRYGRFTPFERIALAIEDGQYTIAESSIDRSEKQFKAVKEESLSSSIIELLELIVNKELCNLLDQLYLINTFLLYHISLMAARMNNIRVMQWCFDHKLRFLRDVLDSAIIAGNIDIVKMLEEYDHFGRDNIIEFIDGYRAILTAIEHGRIAIIEMFLSQYDDEDTYDEYIELAQEHKQSAVVTYLKGIKEGIAGY